jgi:hypothetical protein
MQLFTNRVPVKVILLLQILLLLCAADLSAQAGGTYMQGGHSGGYYNVEQSGHGFFAEVLDDESSPTGKRLLVAWYAFFNGQQIWLLATGHVVKDGDAHIAYMTTWIYEGNGFPPDYDPRETVEIVWGEMTWFFIGCDRAHVSWVSDFDEYGSGELELQRLTTISDSVCDPDFGGEEADDHGNRWQTATFFPSRTTYNDSIEGTIDYIDDVDVFTFNVLENQNMALFTLGSTDTVGTLHRLESTREIEVEMDDNDGVFQNFLITRGLSAGTYTLHVEGATTGGRGEYSVWIQTNP